MDGDRECYPPALQAAWRWAGPLAVVHLIIMVWRFGLAYLVRTRVEGGWQDGLKRPLEEAPWWNAWFMAADQWPGWGAFLWDLSILGGSLLYWCALLVVLEMWAHTSEMRHKARTEARLQESLRQRGKTSPPTTPETGTGGE